MKTSMFEKGIPTVLRVCVLSLLVSAGLAGVGCGFAGGLSDDNLDEGTRCNPYASHNECSSGLVCAGYPPTIVAGAIPPANWTGAVIPFCPENYCCSSSDGVTINSSNVWCQPGCNGGALSMCNANVSLYADACAFAGVDTGAPPPSGGDGGSE